jgi:hypothetical protein
MVLNDQGKQEGVAGLDRVDSQCEWGRDRNARKRKHAGF